MRWRGHSQVERVDLYTRQSLHVLLWGFTGFVLVRAWGREDTGQPELAIIAAACLVTTAAASVALRAVMALYPARGPLPWRSIAPFLGLVLLLLALGMSREDAERGTAVLVAFFTTAIALGGLRDRRAATTLLVALSVVPSAIAAEPLGLPVALGVAVFFVFTVRVSLWLLAVVVELDTARDAQAALAVAEERLRFSRDVHDVLGRRLSTVAVRAELAATLAARGDARAEEAMLEVRETAHTALREARELARGYRPTNLTQELEGARSLLGSAGIEARIDVSGVPDSLEEPAAWTVREAVTNVLRHSAATWVAITWSAPHLDIENDGAPDTDPGTGAGLNGLRERLAPSGGSIEAGSTGGTFRLRARLPHPDDPEQP